jgi:hypothetical protein
MLRKRELGFMVWNFHLQLQSNSNKVKFIFLILKNKHPSMQTNERQECSSSWLMVISSDSLGRLTRSFFNNIL